MAVILYCVRYRHWADRPGMRYTQRFFTARELVKWLVSISPGVQVIRIWEEDPDV